MSGGIDIQLQVQQGTFNLALKTQLPGRGVTALFGPSGCGKTTALRAIAGLTRPTQARISVNGVLWQDDAARQWLAPHQRPLGYVFQEANLFVHLSVRQNVEYGLRRRHSNGKAPAIVLEHAIELLGIAPLMQRPVTHLSGGEAQRVAIARALASSPQLLLMDEPLAALDAARKAELMPYLDRLGKELALPIIYVSHSMDEVSRLADELLLLHNGQLLAQGPVADLMTRLDLPLARGLPGDHQAAIAQGTVCAHDAQDHLWSMQLGPNPQHQLHWTEPAAHYQIGDRVRLRILARDVSLSLAPPQGSSILNSLPVTVAALQASGPGQVLVQMQLQSGDTDARLLALVSARSARVLQLTQGMRLHAQLKSVAVLR
ncbi:MAG: molybdenum ABC transporter ATP-binding protein [Comamonas sp.]